MKKSCWAVKIENRTKSTLQSRGLPRCSKILLLSLIRCWTSLWVSWLPIVLPWTSGLTLTTPKRMKEWDSWEWEMEMLWRRKDRWPNRVSRTRLPANCSRRWLWKRVTVLRKPRTKRIMVRKGRIFAQIARVKLSWIRARRHYNLRESHKTRAGRGKAVQGDQLSIIGWKKKRSQFSNSLDPSLPTPKVPYLNIQLES